MRSKPQISRGTDLVNMHTKMLREVDGIFVGQPSNSGGRGSGPLRPPGPSRYFGLPMVNLSRPSYHQMGLIVDHLTTMSM